MTLQVPLHSGSELKFREAMWGPIYEAVLSILGSTGSILPFGDPHHGKPSATTFKTVGAEQLSFTWAVDTAWQAFDNHKDLADSDTKPYLWQGIIPVINPNGSDERGTTPNNTYWFTDDGGSEKVSMGAWVNLPSTSGSQHLLSNWASNQWEFQWLVDGGTLVYVTRDRSAAVNVQNAADSTLTAGEWVFVVLTYDGAGGSSAMDGVTHYKNGVVWASSATNDANYVGMEDGSQGPDLWNSATSGYLNGKIAGGPLGMFFTKAELTADQVLRLYELGRRALAL